MDGVVHGQGEDSWRFCVLFLDERDEEGRRGDEDEIDHRCPLLF